jgi:hypothetical protein
MKHALSFAVIVFLVVITTASYMPQELHGHPPDVQPHSTHGEHVLPNWLLTTDPEPGKSRRFAAVDIRHQGMALTFADLAYLSARKDPWCLEIREIILDRDGLKELAKSKSCTAIGFHYTNVDDSFFELLEESPSIESILLSRLLITDKALESIAKIKNLKRLYVSDCDLLTWGASLRFKKLRPDVEVSGEF